MAGHRRGQGRARAPKGAATLRPLAHRPFRRGKVDDRESGRSEAPQPGAAHLSARRGQHPQGAHQGSRLHRCRQGGEHPPCGGGGEADGRRRPDRDRVVHLPIHDRAAYGPGATRGEGVHRGVHRARRGEIKNFTGIDSPYEPPETPEIHIDTALTSAEEAADRIIDELRRRGILEER